MVSVAKFGIAAFLLTASTAQAGEVYGYDLRGVDRLVSFPATDPLTQTVIDPDTLSTGWESFGIDFNNAGDTLYIVNNTFGPGNHRLDTIDVGTGTFAAGVVITGPFQTDTLAAGSNETALANDPTGAADTFYLSTGVDLYTVNSTTGASTSVGPFSGMTGAGAVVGLMIDISIDNSGQMYGHDITNDFVWSIDKTTGVCTFVGATGLAANFAQGMDFDPDTNTLYMAIYTGGGTGSYGTFDTGTGVFTQIQDNLNIPDGSNEFEIAIRSASGPDNTGAAYCFGDGSGAVCPCAQFGNAGEGCLTTSGTGALLTGSGNADVANDTFQLDITGAPANKPGLFFQGVNQLALPAGDGLLCSNSTLRYGVNSTDANGNVTQTGFGANAATGQALNYQYWFRDTGNPCGLGGFNFSNGWAVTWN